MILLGGTSAALQAVTSATGTVDVHTSWVDAVTATGAITPGTTNTKITTAGTTSLAGSPAAGSVRNVKTCTVRNTGASIVVTLQHTDGTNACTMRSVNLGTGETLEYDSEGTGWRVFDSTGTERSLTLGGGRFIRSLVISNVTTTTWTCPSDVTYLRLRLLGGGGAGGSAQFTASSASAASGGQAGGYAEATVFGVTPGTVYTIAIGTAGAAGAAGANAGGNGGATTFNFAGFIFTAAGGSGGATQAAGTTPLVTLGGAGLGTATNGDINAVGGAGGPGLRLSGTVALSGNGADSQYGSGGRGVIAQGAGAAGGGFGAGGSGGLGLTATVAGGAGSAGVLIIDQYS